MVYTPRNLGNFYGYDPSQTLQLFFTYLQQTKSYKVINKDQWACFLTFSRDVKKDLSNYDNSEACKLTQTRFCVSVQLTPPQGHCL